jgi:UDP-glucose 4-epimerase
VKTKGIVVYDNLSTGHIQAIPGIVFVGGDILDNERLAFVFKKYRISEVMHFAASSIVGESMKNPLDYYRNNVQGTMNLLNVMLQKKAHKLVFSSSAAVYGEPEEMPISEEYPLKPLNTYGKTKAMVEQILEDYHRAYGLNYISLRYFNACGADDAGLYGEDHNPETHLIPLVIKTALGQNDRLNVFGDDYPTPDGTCVRDYVHVDDIAEAHLSAYQYLKDQETSQIFNIGSRKGYSVLEILKAVEHELKRKLSYQVLPRRPGDPPILVADNSKISRFLGWHPKRSLDYIISSACLWHQMNPFGFSIDNNRRESLEKFKLKTT